MKRKVIQIANSTQLVSLPRKWAQMYNIKKGDELDVEIDGSRIIVSGIEPKQESKSIDITIKSKEKFLKRYIDNLYRTGYDEIRVNHTDPEIANIIQDNLKSLLGFEIVNQQPNLCVIKNIASAMDEEFDPILKRVFVIQQSMNDELYNALKNNKFKDLQNIFQSERMNNKLTNFCLRILNKKGYPNYSKTGIVYYVVSQLEEIGDEYKYIVTHVLNEKSFKASETHLQLIRIIGDLFDLFRKMFYKYDLTIAYEFKRKAIDAKSKLNKLYKKSKQKEIQFVGHFESILNKLRHLSLHVC